MKTELKKTRRLGWGQITCHLYDDDEADWYSTRLPKALRVAGRFKEYLRDNKIKYEASEVGDFIYFEVYVDRIELRKANEFIDTLDDVEGEFRYV